MTRRQLLLGGAAVLALAGLPAAASGDATHAAALRLAAITGPSESARLVGRAALAALPRGGEASLVREIATALGAVPSDLARISEPRLRRLLRARIRDEHRTGITLDVEGWQLAATEARLYGLAALATGR